MYHFPHIGIRKKKKSGFSKIPDKKKPFKKITTNTKEPTTNAIAAGVLLYKGKILMPSLKIVSLYPNPGNGNITIRCAGNVKELDVFDMNGILIKKYAITEGSTKRDLSWLKPGAYIAVIRNAQRSSSQKFIMQKFKYEDPISL